MRSYFCVLAVLLIGCATHPTVTDGQHGSSWPELIVDVSAEPLLLERGGTLHIRLTVTNERDTPVVKGFASGCIYGFAVRNSRGDRVAPPPPICTANAPVVTWAPGEVVTAEFTWTWDDPNIEPGYYSVEAGFGPLGEGGSAVEVQLR